MIWDREVGGSNPLAPTSNLNSLLLPSSAAVYHLSQIVNKLNWLHVASKMNGANVAHGSFQIRAHQLV